MVHPYTSPMSSPGTRSLAASVLLADDDAQLAVFLSKSLETEGYSVHTALDEGSVLEELKRQSYQLIILDLNFGQTDGLILLEKLRTAGVETPVMVLSARNQVSDRIQSLNLGADDYVTKPFSFQELSARANALLRRKTDPALSILRVADLELDPATRKAHRGKREIKLSPKEFDLLYMLLRRSGNTVSRTELLRECWGHELETDSNLVDVYVNYLRKKVDFPEDEKLIYTVRGEGYRLGRSISSTKGGDEDQAEPVRSLASHSFPPATIGEGQNNSTAQVPLRAMVHSVAHDLAQPLTSLRCFLEVLAMNNNLTASQASDLALIEQQADRAIALTKGISAMVREAEVSTEPWIPLDRLVNDVSNDFNVLVNAGMLSVERKWEASLEVSSSPVLRQLVLLLFSKLAGRNTRPLLLLVAAGVKDGHAQIHFSWKATDSSADPLFGARTIFSRDFESLVSMASSVSGEFSIVADHPEVVLTVPAQIAPGSKAGLVH